MVVASGESAVEDYVQAAGTGAKNIYYFAQAYCTAERFWGVYGGISDLITIVSASNHLQKIEIVLGGRVGAWAGLEACGKVADWAGDSIEIDPVLGVWVDLGGAILCSVGGALVGSKVAPRISGWAGSARTPMQYLDI